jgi:hypothetical protein
MVGESLVILVQDADRNADTAAVETISISITRTGGEQETVTLTENGPNTGLFQGTLATRADTGSPADNDGVLDVRPRQTVIASYLDERRADGSSAILETRSQVVAAIYIERLMVVDLNGNDLFELTNGMLIDLSQHPCGLSGRADTVPNRVGSVRFNLDNETFKIENDLPYALNGNEVDGRYRPVNLSARTDHFVETTPYTQRAAAGDPGRTIIIRFTVTGNCRG